MRESAVLDYTIRQRGLPMSSRTLISRWEPPDLFADEQVKGAVRYVLPMGTLGRVALPIVRAHLLHLFAYLQEAVRRILVGEARGQTRAEE
jgi:hypothetical protein